MYHALVMYMLGKIELQSVKKDSPNFKSKNAIIGYFRTAPCTFYVILEDFSLKHHFFN